MLTRERLRLLYDQYLDLVRREVEEFGVKPTQLTHLIGRLGEFHCALETGGELAAMTNQPGFDVVCLQGRRISVKATAQRSGFVIIGRSTIDRAEDLMLVQYKDGAMSTLYYGPIDRAVAASKTYPQYPGRYELGLGAAQRLSKEAVPLA